MNLKRLTDRAKDLVNKRGGTGALKEDAEEVKDIATGEGSLKTRPRPPEKRSRTRVRPGEQERKPPQ